MRIKTRLIKMNMSWGFIMRNELYQQQNRISCRVLPYPSIPYCPPSFGKVKRTTQHLPDSDLSSPVIREDQIKDQFWKLKETLLTTNGRAQGKVVQEWTWCRNEEPFMKNQLKTVFCADMYWDAKKIKIIFGRSIIWRKKCNALRK